MLCVVYVLCLLPRILHPLPLLEPDSAGFPRDRPQLCREARARSSVSRFKPDRSSNPLFAVANARRVLKLRVRSLLHSCDTELRRDGNDSWHRARAE